MNTDETEVEDRLTTQLSKAKVELRDIPPHKRVCSPERHALWSFGSDLLEVAFSFRPMDDSWTGPLITINTPDGGRQTVADLGGVYATSHVKDFGWLHYNNHQNGTVQQALDILVKWLLAADLGNPPVRFPDELFRAHEAMDYPRKWEVDYSRLRQNQYYEFVPERTLEELLEDCPLTEEADVKEETNSLPLLDRWLPVYTPTGPSREDSTTAAVLKDYANTIDAVFQGLAKIAEDESMDYELCLQQLQEVRNHLSWYAVVYETHYTDEED